MKLSDNELRVIGCLIEKSITTPDHYPLSINALTNACNQKSNREPILSLSEVEVQSTIDSLNERHLVMRQAGVTSRVAKYQHRFCNTEFSDLQFSAQELAILCVMFLRGPQTAGELRTRTQRLCQFTNIAEVDETLSSLATSEQGAHVVQLAREPGRRESRYHHCFGIEEPDGSSKLGQSPNFVTSPNFDSANNLEHTVGADLGVNHNDSNQADLLPKLKALEEMVELLQLEVDELRERLDALE